MRSKKLARQIKKTFDNDGLEEELPALLEWAKGQGETTPASVMPLFENFVSFLDSVDSSYEQLEKNLEHAQRSLAVSSEEVEIRNKELRVEVRKVSNLLNNMRQAVFSVDAKGALVAPVSKFAVEVFGADLVGKNVFDILYKDMDPKGEEIASLKSAIIGVFGADEMQWDLMEGYFPRRVIINRPPLPSGEANPQILKVAVAPIWDDANLLDKVMYVIEDVTALEQLERKMAEEREKSTRNMRMIQELLALSRPNLVEFLSRSMELIQEVNKEIDAKGQGSDFNLIFRHLHTIKGNSRGYKMVSISGAAHIAESEIVPLRENPSLWVTSEATFRPAMKDLAAAVEEYVELAKRLFGIDVTAKGASSSTSASASREVPTEHLKELTKMMKALKAKYDSPEVAQAAALLNQMVSVSAKAVVEDIANMAQDVAHETGRELDLQIEDKDSVYLEADIVAPLKDALGHLVRNAIDHGLEKPEDREKSGKPKAGKVVLAFEKRDGSVCLTVRDDGRGLDPEKIARKAFEKGLVKPEALDQMSEEEKMDLIFLPGFSTSENVSEISGRGVGLDAVKSTVESLNARMERKTQKGAGTEFTIVIKDKAS